MVHVQNFTKTIGGIGQNKWDTPDGLPIPVPCNVHPLTAEELVADGLQSIDSRKVVADKWPGNIHSRITFRDEEWDQVGPAKVHDISDHANSIQITIKKRG